MRNTTAFPARSSPVWHLLLIALALGLLVLFCPGRSAAELWPTSDVLVPYFEVDLEDPEMGLTTLFAVANASPHAADILMTVHTNWGIPLLRIPLVLKADEVRSFNLRDWIVRGDLPDRRLTPEEVAHVQAALCGMPSPGDGLYYGSEDEEKPKLALGYVTIRTTGPGRPDVLWGDYYVVDGRRGFFQAETLVDIDPVHGCLPTNCTRHAVRFLNAGSLARGTQILIWTARSWAPSPTPAPLGAPVATDISVFNEPGRHVEDRRVGILPVQVIEVDDLDLQPEFGWLDIVTEEPSFITQHLHTTSTPSAVLHAYCLPVDTQSPGPAINLEKLVNGADADFPPGPSIPIGAAVTWEFLVENTGTEPLTEVTVTDSSGATVSCPQTALEPQETMTCTLSGTARACEQHNLGQVVAYGPDLTEVSDEDHAYYTGDPNGSLGLKTRVNGFDADGPEGTWPQFDPGETLHWTFDVTNTGDVELTNLSVKADPLVVTCPKTVLQPGEVMTCTASSVAVAGRHQVTTTATGATPCGSAATVTQAGYANYFVEALEPRIDLEKRINGEDADVAPGLQVETGAALTWTFVVTNVGEVPLSGVTVTDPSFASVPCPKTELAVGESMTCTVPGTAQACQVANLATATGTAPDTSVVSDQDPAHYFGQHHAALTLEKLIEGQDADTAPGPDLRIGSTAHFSYVVTNTGDVPLTPVVVTDDRLGEVTCPKSELDSGESMTCTATSIVGPGQYYNVGSAVGAPPCGAAVSASDPAHYYGRSPSISLQKLTNGQDADTAPGPSIPVGAAVLWTYVATNTGDTVLTNVTVTDDKGVAVTCPKTELSPGESMTCTASGTAVAGQYANVGAVIGTPTVGPDVTATDPSHYFGYLPLLTLEKRVNGQDADTPPGPGLLVGSTIAWTYLVTNTGDVRLTSVSVTDDQGLAVTCPKTALDPGESMTCTASSKAEVGQHQNVGTATGTPPAGPPVTATDPANYLGLMPGISLEKLVNGNDADTAPGPSFLVGTPLLWTYIVTNTGDVSLTNVTVTDSDGFAIDCPKTTLAPGESMTCSACALAAFDVKCPAYCLAEAGQHSNIGRATGTPEGGSPIWAEDPAHYFGEMLGNQGCTPGYWKNHTDSWPPTGYSPTQKVKTVFANVNTYYPTLGNATLLSALGFAGGPGGEGAAEILLRAAVAALLNASHPNVAYPRTPASIIADVNDALLQTRDPMLALAAQLDADNNLGCPLN